MWKDIHEWEDLYEVNSCGDVRNKLTGKLIIGDKNSTGYMRVCLYRKGHIPEKKRFFRHRLVAEHFIPNPYQMPEVNHKDCDISNNTVENLEWVSKIENEHHSHVFGNKPYRGYFVEYENGKIDLFSSCGELARCVCVTNRTVINWLQGKSNGFQKHGIKSIYYRDSA